MQITRRSFMATAGGAGLILASPFGIARADDASSPVGNWRTIDDNTHQPTSIVKIYPVGNLLYGSVEQILDGTSPTAVCEKCTDDRANKPIIGLQIIRGLKADGNVWDGGTIIDPKNGSVYRCKISLKDDGKTLAVRGFLGIALLGRTQYWQRTDD